MVILSYEIACNIFPCICSMFSTYLIRAFCAASALNSALAAHLIPISNGVGPGLVYWVARKKWEIHSENMSVNRLIIRASFLSARGGEKPPANPLGARGFLAAPIISFNASPCWHCSK